jgi:ubiquinone/menaquinone biosynthesis C-methylase UbiE
MNDDKRREYWNDDYVRYWQQRVEEANRSAEDSQVVEKDSAVPPDRLYVDLIRSLEILPRSHVLEIGCGFGRTIPIIFAITSQIDAVDISEAMIEMARKNCGHLTGASFYVSEAEKMPFPPERFEQVICFGVFDALYQREALLEINRVMVPQGRALITGKNDCYLADDDKAFVAEVNARAKGHPNYFTDVSKLISNLHAFGFAVLHQRFYLRRGDTAQNRFTFEKPARFYEYALILEKRASPTADAKNLLFSAPVSKTFSEKSGRVI